MERSYLDEVLLAKVHVPDRGLRKGAALNVYAAKRVLELGRCQGNPVFVVAPGREFHSFCVRPFVYTWSTHSRREAHVR